MYQMQMKYKQMYPKIIHVFLNIALSFHDKNILYWKLPLSTTTKYIHI